MPDTQVLTVEDIKRMVLATRPHMEPVRPVLFCGKNSMAVWRAIFGDAVDYHELRPIPVARDG